MVLEFIANFESSIKRVGIRGGYYQVTLAIITHALRCELHLPKDEQLCKDWIKDYSTEAAVWALGEILFYEV